MEAKAPMMYSRNFAPGGKISINHKDIKNVVNTAHQLDIPVPFSAQLFEVMQGLKVRDLMDEDHSAIVKHFELLADQEVRKGES
jgi:2-hydroxy-3-oxopropionate reductase